MTAIARLTRPEPREPIARAAPAKHGDASFRAELARTGRPGEAPADDTAPVRGRTPIKRVTIPPATAPVPTGDPMVAVVTGTAPMIALPAATPASPLVVAATGGIAVAPAADLGAAPVAAPPVPLAQPATPTPLEQAVQALLAQLQPGTPGTDDEDEPGLALEVPVEPGAATAAAVPVRTTDPQRAHVAPAAATASPEPAAEPLANPSHVHLVMDDGDERVVVTVAVRGNEVRVALRANDDTTVAAFARNAGSLDHALRARGLDLTEFTAPDRERERTDREPHDPPPERPHPRAPRFRLEDNA